MITNARVKNSFAQAVLLTVKNNQNMKLFKNEKWDNIINENRKIRIDILGDAHVEAKSANFELFENIHTLIEATTKSDFFNVLKEQESYDFLIKYLTREVIKEVKKSEEVQENPEFGWNFITKIAVSNFNKRYTHLNESEKDLLGKLLSTHENKKNYLQDLKEEVTKSINLAVDNSKDDEGKIIFEAFKSKLAKIGSLDESKIDDALIDLTGFKETIKEFIESEETKK